MAVHTPDNIEKFLENDEENDYSKNLSNGTQPRKQAVVTW